MSRLRSRSTEYDVQARLQHVATYRLTSSACIVKSRTIKFYEKRERINFPWANTCEIYRDLKFLWARVYWSMKCDNKSIVWEIQIIYAWFDLYYDIDFEQFIKLKPIYFCAFRFELKNLLSFDSITRISQWK